MLARARATWSLGKAFGGKLHLFLPMSPPWQDASFPLIFINLPPNPCPSHLFSYPAESVRPHWTRPLGKAFVVKCNLFLPLTPSRQDASLPPKISNLPPNTCSSHLFYFLTLLARAHWTRPLGKAFGGKLNLYIPLPLPWQDASFSRKSSNLLWNPLIFFILLSPQSRPGPSSLDWTAWQGYSE